MIWRRRRDGGAASGLSDADRGVLQALEAAGADLREPRHALFFLYVPGEAAATELAGVARAQGWEVSVSGPSHPDDDDWCVVCERQDVVTDPSTLPALSSSFLDLATAHGGRYDGWEASV